jgi:hypothetical protein
MADVTSGGNGTNGTVSVFGKDNQPLIQLLGRDAECIIGAGQKTRPGRLTMYDGSGNQIVNLTTANAHFALGGAGQNGRVSVYGADGQPMVELIAAASECIVGLGQQNRPGRLSVYGADRSEKVRLDGNTGDIMIANADCAEEFDTSSEIEAGDVVVLTSGGSVAPCTQPYDRRVAGVVSGAGPYRPALILDRRSTEFKRVPVALLGKVFCRVDVGDGRIEVGDLLTTGMSAGCAMRATDPERSHGAILGKALASHSGGPGIIPVLIALQ